MQYGLRSTFLVLALSACYRPPVDPTTQGSYRYEVEAPAEGSRSVTVQATFIGARTDRIGIARESTAFVHDMELVARDGLHPVSREGNEWHEGTCRTACTVRYRVDLGALAAACGDEVDCARRVGFDATLSPALAWLVHPVPKRDVPVTVHVETPNAVQFASGMQPSDETGHNFAFRSYDLDEGSFTAFGPMRRYRIIVDHREIDVAIIDRTKYTMNNKTIKN